VATWVIFCLSTSTKIVSTNATKLVSYVDLSVLDIEILNQYLPKQFYFSNVTPGLSITL
jgi:hypothetical protein